MLPENVYINLHQLNFTPSGCLPNHSSFAPLFIPGNLYVDVDGRNCSLCSISEGFCYQTKSLHHWIHNCQLWYVQNRALYVVYQADYCIVMNMSTVFFQIDAWASISFAVLSTCP